MSIVLFVREVEKVPVEAVFRDVQSDCELLVALVKAQTTISRVTKGTFEAVSGALKSREGGLLGR